MKFTIIFKLMVGWILLFGLPSMAFAQTYSRTEAVEYYDNEGVWVLGQAQKTTCVASVPANEFCDGGTDSVVSEATYDPGYAMPTTKVRFGKAVETLTYDIASTVASGQRGTLRTVRDGNNNVTTLSNWKSGIPQLITYADGSTQSAVVNDAGWIASVNDEVNSKTCYAYDGMGRVNKITYPSETQPNVCDTSKWAATTIDFAPQSTGASGLPAGYWRQDTVTGNYRKHVYYDALWRPVVVREHDQSQVSGTTRFTRYAYDHEGRTTFASYPGTAHNLTKGVWTDYDALGRVIRTRQDWEGSGQLTTSTAYLSNAQGYYTQVTNPRGGISRTWYQAFDQPSYDAPVRIQHDNGYSYTDINRDLFGKPSSLIRRKGDGTQSLTRTYTYNANQELCRSVEPETGATLMGYDGAGNLSWSAAGLPTNTACHATGNTTAINARKAVRSYDARNRVKALAFPDGRGNQVWTYAANGLPTAIAANNSNGGDVVTTTYGYHRRGLPLGETFSVGVQLWGLSYAYDALGNLLSHTSPGLVIDYAPNALGQPTKAGSYASAVSYFPNGGIQQFTYGNGIKHTLVQNQRGLPDTSCDFAGSSCAASAVLRDSYDYDGHGNVLAITDGRTGNRGNRDMTYDALDRLTQTVSPMFGTANYSYDIQDNLRTVQVTGGTRIRQHTYLYDAKNQLTNVTNTMGGATVAGLGYDVQGNLANKNGVAHDFDFGNRLRSASGEQYRYDGHGRRVLAVRNGQNLYSLYGQDGTLRFQRDERTGKTIDYVHLGGSLVAQVENAIALSTPTLTVPSSSSTGSYAVSWTTVPHASRYQLQERSGSGGWSTIHDAGATSKAISGKAAGVWGYQVRACSATACGSWSPAASATVQLPPGSAPALNVPATAYNGNFSVTWTSVAAATSYQLQERLGTGSWTTVHDAATTSKAITGKTAGSWGYQVRGCGAAGCSGWSPVSSVQVIHQPSSAPALTLPATNLTGGYTVSWSNVATATRYEVEERLGTGSWAQIHNAAATSKAISGKTTGSWSYRARACNEAGCSGWSSTATVAVTRPPTSAPTLTVPATSTTGSYSVTWGAVTHASSYQLQERLETGSWSTVHDAATTSKAISGKTVGSWGYQVRACNAAGCSGWSAIKAVQVIHTPGSAPALTVPATNLTGSYSVTWSSVATSTRYELEEQLGSGGWTQIHNAAATSKAISGKVTGSWGYRARACNDAGCSGWSSTATVVVTRPPATPTLSLTWMGPISFTASWPAVPTASIYQLQRQLDNGVWVADWEGSATSKAYSGPHGIYRYQLRACNVAGCSAWTPTNTMVLAPPGGGGPGDPDEPPCTRPPCSIEP